MTNARMIHDPLQRVSVKVDFSVAHTKSKINEINSGGKRNLSSAVWISSHETIPSRDKNVFDIRTWLESSRFSQNLLADFFIHIDRRIHSGLNQFWD